MSLLRILALPVAALGDFMDDSMGLEGHRMERLLREEHEERMVRALVKVLVAKKPTGANP